jgi:hypothetical protein
VVADSSSKTPSSPPGTPKVKETRRVADWTTHFFEREGSPHLTVATHHRAEELDCPVCVDELAPKKKKE